LPQQTYSENPRYKLVHDTIFGQMMRTKIKVNWGGKLFPLRFFQLACVCAFSFGTVKAKPEINKDRKTNGKLKVN